MFAHSLEIRVTLEDLRQTVPRLAGETEAQRLLRMNSLLCTTADGACLRHYETLAILLNRALVFRPSYVDLGFCSNASDSIMTMLLRYADFVGDLSVRLEGNGETIRLAVEDNGTGIDPEIEPLLFASTFSSPKKQEALGEMYLGGRGIHLYEAKKRIEAVGGKIDYINKGKNRGALFWYEIPVERP